LVTYQTEEGSSQTVCADSAEAKDMRQKTGQMKMLIAELSLNNRRLKKVAGFTRSSWLLS